MNNEERIQSELTMMAEGPDHLGPDLPISNPEPLPHTDGVEQVLCIPADLLELADIKDKGVWPRHTTLADIQQIHAEFCKSDNVSFIDRPLAESAKDYVQLIPYCVIIRGREIFCYKRKGSEGRLTGLFSCGVGGHINPVDARDTLDGSYYAGLKRELLEEVGLPDVGEPRAEALIYDDSNDVGKVHLGVVHIIRIDLQTKLTFADEALSGGDFWPASELLMKIRAEPDLYETWTQLVLRNLFS